MTAKEYLRRYAELKRIANQYKTEYEQELQTIDSVRSTLGGDGLPHGTGINKPVEDKAIRLADKAAQWKMAELDALQVRQEVFEVVASVPGIEGTVLYERYINLRKWEEICVLVHYTWRGVHKVHRRALERAEIIIRKRAL